MDTGCIAFLIVPVRAVAKAVHTHTAEFRIARKPFFWPVMQSVGRLTPGLPRATSETVDKYEVYDRVFDRME